MSDPGHDELTRSLLAGLASDGADPDAADDAERSRLASVGPDDYLIPPDPDADDDPDDDGDDDDPDDDELDYSDPAMFAAPPSGPPRPGLVWKEATHRWVKGEQPAAAAKKPAAAPKPAPAPAPKLQPASVPKAKPDPKAASLPPPPPPPAVSPRSPPPRNPPATPGPKPAPAKSGTHPDANPALPDATRPEMSASEHAAVRQYTTGRVAGSTAATHHDVNDTLRDGGKLTGDAARLHGELQRAFAKAEPFAEPVKVHRGISLSARGLDRFAAAAEQSRASGKPLAMSGYVSTSTDPKSIYAGANVQMEISAVRGIDTGPDAAYKTERELLLNHGSQFRVVGVERSGNNVRVRLEQLPHDAPAAAPPPPPPPRSVAAAVGGRASPGLLRRLAAWLGF